MVRFNVLLSRLIGNLAGLWSRRIDEMRRLVYEANDLTVTIVACRFHYGD
jgi:toxin YoeB